MTHGVIAGYVFFSSGFSSIFIIIIEVKTEALAYEALIFCHYNSIVLQNYFFIIYYHFFVAQFYHYNNSRRRLFTGYSMLICYFLQKAKREKTRALNPQFMDTALRRSP